MSEIISAQLTSHDIDVLQKIKDPEFAPSGFVLIEDSLPKDPHLTIPSEYDQATAIERNIIRRLQSLGPQQSSAEHDLEAYATWQTIYLDCVLQLDDLIARFPNYASSYNNKAQAMRQFYGESILLEPYSLDSTELEKEQETREAAICILSDLQTVITLLSPRPPFAAISTQAAKTLSQAYTQRGALYHTTAKQIASNPKLRLRIGLGMKWTREDLAEMASRDFAMGGRYGNEIAKGLAVATNPTAKLCGNIVREAMMKEMGEL
jgi:hypothetical protein